jgi:hypothetical protein
MTGAPPGLPVPCDAHPDLALDVESDFDSDSDVAETVSVGWALSPVGWIFSIPRQRRPVAASGSAPGLPG